MNVRSKAMASKQGSDRAQVQGRRQAPAEAMEEEKDLDRLNALATQASSSSSSSQPGSYSSR